MEECSAYELTSAQLWEPYDSKFREHEERLLAEATTEPAVAAEPKALLARMEPDSTSPKEEESASEEELDSFDNSNLLEWWIQLEETDRVSSVNNLWDGSTGRRVAG
jgi:hypothetical protein